MNIKKKLLSIGMVFPIVAMFGCAPYEPIFEADVPATALPTPQPIETSVHEPEPEQTATPTPRPIALPTPTPQLPAEQTPEAQEQSEDMTDVVIDIFKEIALIPRPSHEEHLMRDYITAWAQEHGFAHEEDEYGNVIVDRPASTGYGQAPLVLLQAHQDMVTVQKEGYDSLTDPITVLDDGITLTADGTTLGADDGIGVAIVMAIFENEDEAGALRAIFTTDEEDGMDGARSLSAHYFEEAKYLINVDGEDGSGAFISSAGSLDYTYTMDVQGEDVTKTTPLEIKISGLAGGHSGVDINLGRASAIKIAAQTLDVLIQNDIPFELASIKGGSARNAIPTDCSVVIVADASAEERIKTLVTEVQESVMAVYGQNDPEITMSVLDADVPTEVFSNEDMQTLVSVIELQRTGVIAMSQEVAGMVETSCNMGTIAASPEGVSISVMSRTSKDAMQDSLLVTATALAKLTGVQIRDVSSYPGWPANADSELSVLMSDIFMEQNSREFNIQAIHAGLECGHFAEKNPKMDIISVGPDISYPHTANETLDKASVGITYALIAETLNRLAK